MSTEPVRMFEHEKANPLYWSSIEQLDEPTLEDITKKFQEKLSRIEVIKREIIQKRRELEMRAAARLAVLENLSLNSDTWDSPY